MIPRATKTPDDVIINGEKGNNHHCREILWKLGDSDWLDLLKEYDLRPFKSGYDNRFAKDFQNRYVELFGDKITVNIPQEAKALNNPMRTLEEDLRGKLVNYQNNPICFWCFCNTGIKVDSLGRIMPVKMHSTKRIDGTASKIIAYATLELCRSEFMELINN